MIAVQKYVRAKSLEEAYTLNQNKRNIVVGGMMWIRMGNGNFQTAVDLCDLGLDTVEETEEEFRIGAMVTLRQLELHPGLAAYTCGAMENAVKDIVGVQFRNMATLGGSIFGRYGFSDVLTQFLSMDAYVELYEGGIMRLEEFAAKKADRDLLVRLIVKKKPGRFAYLAMRKAKTDFPVLTCAVSEMEGKVQVVVGARPGRAIVFLDEKNILKEGINKESARLLSEDVAERVATGSNVRGSAAYRKHLAAVLTERALLEL